MLRAQDVLYGDVLYGGRAAGREVLRSFLDRGLAQDIRVESEPYTGFTQITATYDDHYRSCWRIGLEEIYNGDIRHFLAIVEEGLERDAQTHQNHRGERPNDEGQYDIRRNAERYLERVYQRRFADTLLQNGWSNFLGDPFFTKEAEQKAKDLFRKVAGESAWQQITHVSKPQLPLVGSLGTKYHLHPRATYCVTRDNDGAKLCAVVPKVPLWDHLLGIKLMVEQDELKFLSVANVSPGRNINTDAFNYDLRIQMPNSVFNLDTIA